MIFTDKYLENIDSFPKCYMKQDALLSNKKAWGYLSSKTTGYPYPSDNKQHSPHANGIVAYCLPARKQDFNIPKNE